MNPPDSSTCPSAAAITRQSGSNLAFAFGCLPRTRRRDMVTFYAFCRVVDDIADDPGLERSEKQRRLDDWRALIGLERDPLPGLEQDLAGLLDRYPGIRRDLLLDIIAGMEMDLDTVRFATYADLEGYCYRVASAVGLVSIEIFGCTRPESGAYALELGHALQLTNIIRDVGEDLREDDRIYLPAEDLERFAVTEEGLRSGRPGTGFGDLMRFEADRAEARYQAALEHLPPEDRRALRASEMMRRVYHALLTKMRQDGFRVLETRYRLSSWEKLGFLLGAILRP